MNRKAAWNVYLREVSELENRQEKAQHKKSFLGTRNALCRPPLRLIGDLNSPMPQPFNLRSRHTFFTNWDDRDDDDGDKTFGSITQFPSLAPHRRPNAAEFTFPLQNIQDEPEESLARTPENYKPKSSKQNAIIPAASWRTPKPDVKESSKSTNQCVSKLPVRKFTKDSLRTNTCLSFPAKKSEVNKQPQLAGNVTSRGLVQVSSQALQNNVKRDSKEKDQNADTTLFPVSSNLRVDVKQKLDKSGEMRESLTSTETSSQQPKSFYSLRIRKPSSTNVPAQKNNDKLSVNSEISLQPSDQINSVTESHVFSDNQSVNQIEATSKLRKRKAETINTPVHMEKVSRKSKTDDVNTVTKSSDHKQKENEATLNFEKQESTSMLIPNEQSQLNEIISTNTASLLQNHPCNNAGLSDSGKIELLQSHHDEIPLNKQCVSSADDESLSDISNKVTQNCDSRDDKNVTYNELLRKIEEVNEKNEIMYNKVLSKCEEVMEQNKTMYENIMSKLEEINKVTSAGYKGSERGNGQCSNVLDSNRTGIALKNDDAAALMPPPATPSTQNTLLNSASRTRSHTKNYKNVSIFSPRVRRSSRQLFFPKTPSVSKPSGFTTPLNTPGKVSSIRKSIFKTSAKSGGKVEGQELHH